ncbi:MAG: circadian clock protein KaiC [Candidatus Eremiobacteraeota bacterium]|jgi:circadian clock protein KaiC|nr:circadian clock protein KaiC [Candidatus Eremiobacteraeota bacterium]
MIDRTIAPVRKPAPPRAPTGITGLDEVLHGGYVTRRTYLLTGPPGGGKTTIGWHFLTAGVAAGERVLFITLGESEAELIENAEYSGFETRGVTFCDLSPTADLFEDARSYDIFPASEVELEPTTQRLMQAVRDTRPARVFIDSMTALRYLFKDSAEFRRQTLAFLRYIKEQGGCVLMTSEASDDAPDDDLRFLSDGVIQVGPSERARILSVAKFRGSDYRPGEHTLRLDAAGATVYPRLMPDAYSENFKADRLGWGIPELDAMSHGGLERGTVTLISGPSGVGKTTLGAQFMKAAAACGERSVIYTFDERAATLTERCESVNIPVTEMIDAGRLAIVAVEALKFSSDEFANLVRRDVEDNGTKIVMIDSISGYRMSVSDEALNERLHALCRYLQNVGVTVILINELLNIAEFKITDVGITYLADNVILMRYVERRNGAYAEMGRVLGVLKKRLSGFETTMRSFELTPAGVVIGAPVAHMAGLLGNSHDVASEAPSNCR